MNVIISLFIDDVREICFPKSGDKYVDGYMTFCLSTFCLEFSLLLLVDRRKFLFSFFFYLDLVGIVSLLTEVYFLLNLESSSAASFHLSDPANSFAKVAHVSKASKLGARAGRLLKLIRILKIVRVAKLYRETGKYSDKRKL